MSTALIVETGLLAKYAALTFTPKPDLYADRAPLKDAAGAALATPYAVLTTADEGVDEWMSELDRVEAVGVTLEGYFASGTDAKAFCLGVQYDGGTPSSRSGLDDATGTDFTLPDGYHLNLCERLGPAAVEQLEARDAGAVLAYRATLRYRVTLHVTGDGR
jgi:hypothetical protein